MNPPLVRDALLVLAPCAALLAGLASIDHRQRLVEAGYRVGALRAEREALERSVERRRVAVGRLASPVRLLEEAGDRGLPLDYPRRWNEVRGNGEAARLVGPPVRPIPERPIVARSDGRSGRDGRGRAR